METTTAGKAEYPRALVDGATWLPEWEPPVTGRPKLTYGHPYSPARGSLAMRITEIVRERIAAFEEMLRRPVRDEGDDVSSDPETALLDALDAAVAAEDDGQYHLLLDQLREFQETEARRMRNYFEAQRPLPAGSGYAAIAQARALLEGDEGPSPSNDPADDAD